MAAWQLLARDPAREVAGILTGWALTLTLRHNEVGSWSLRIPPERCPDGWPAPGAGLIFLRDGRVVASGELDERAYSWSADPDSDTSGAGIHNLAGDTDLGRLAYRVVYPTAGAAWTAQTQKHFTTSGTGEAVLRGLANLQAGPGALTTRQVPGLALGAAAGVGTSTQVKERFTPLLDAMRRAADSGGGLAFDVRDTLQQTLQFVVWQPRDLTDLAQFGVELGNVASLDVQVTAPVATTALVAGAEEGTARHTLEKSATTADPAYGRREVFIDQRQVSDAVTPTAEDIAEYTKAADEELAAAGEQTAVAAVIRDTATVAWGRDYGLGDRVSVLTPYGAVEELVREVSITVDATGVEDITSTIGSSQATAGNPLAATVRKLSRRISQLERAL